MSTEAAARRAWVVSTAPAELAMTDQIDVVFDRNAKSRYRSPLTEEWRNGDDLEAWLIEAIDGATEEVLVELKSSVFQGLLEH